MVSSISAPEAPRQSEDGYEKMQTITLRVISGADRGRVFRELATPITIGREEGNVVQLNDERISRFHVKIQEDDGRLVVTDLDSTNGTRINGNVCNLKILRYGDTISIGRTVLLVGTREQVAAWFVDDDDATANAKDQELSSAASHDDSYEFDVSTNLAPGKQSHLSRHNVSLPRGLTTGQAAELRELLDHVHTSMGSVLENAAVDEKENTVTIDFRAWQHLLMTQSEISELIRAIEEPQDGDGHCHDTGAD